MCRDRTETVLYPFCALRGKICPDGANPGDGVIRDPHGDLYGTAGGGVRGNGVVFELIPPNAESARWTETVLYSFCSLGGLFCTDGSDPIGVIRDAAGHLYGTTSEGGGCQSWCTGGSPQRSGNPPG
jgi:hypothetical protein